MPSAGRTFGSTRKLRVVLLMGTLLLQRDPYEGARWRVGVQWLAEHAWFWDRLVDGSWARSGYSGRDSVHGFTAGEDGGLPGAEASGVREPLPPKSPAGSAAIAVPIPD